MPKAPRLEAIAAKSFKDDKDIDGGRFFHWTGWKRRHWPAEVVRPGFKFYAFDKGKRALVALLEVTHGGAFAYGSKRAFAAGVRRMTGWTHDDSDPHWRGIPETGTGLAVRWKLVKRVDFPLGGRFPRLGWHQLDGPMLEAAKRDAADLYLEGGRALREHYAAERSARLRSESKRYWRDKMRGRIRCWACSFEFGREYGSHGADFIEMHHVRQLSAARGRHRRKVIDLIPLCSNCHRMVHRDALTPLTPAALKKLLRSA